jgi:hypothetical protein
MKIDTKKLEKLLKLETHKDIVNDLCKVAGDNYSIYEKDDFCIFTPLYMEEDEKLPCVVSHTDTVSSKKPKHISTINGVMTNPEGVLGADDRAGVYLIYEMMKKGVHAIFILTDLEECGGIGATSCSYDDYFQDLAMTNISCLIELDRENKNHCASYGFDNQELFQIMHEKGGYHYDYGSYTDVATLSGQCEIACVNLSVGYYNQHTKKEFLVLSELEATLNFVIDLPIELYGKVFIAEDDMRFDDDLILNTEICCDVCGDHTALYVSANMSVCLDCLAWSEKGVF